VNGVNAEKITTQDADHVRRILGTDEDNEDLFIAIEDFTIWLAENGSWPVAMRLVILSEQYPFQNSREDDSQAEAPYEVPPEALESYHYGFLIATERQSDGGAEERYRTEITLAISQVNDSSIVVNPPRD